MILTTLKLIWPTGGIPILIAPHIETPQVLLAGANGRERLIKSLGYLKPLHEERFWSYSRGFDQHILV